jgi:putative NADH-flavin reductase
MHGARVECVEDAQAGAGGASRISLEDFATAMVDELERPRHPHQHFPIGY